MKLALIGAPGAGKTTIAKFIANNLKLDHIECDSHFWRGEDLREVVQSRIRSDRWILDGHLSKVGDIVLPEIHHLIIIENLSLKCLFRSLWRDRKNPRRFLFNLQNYERMARKRQEIINGFPGSVQTLNNFPDLTQGELAAFCEHLKAATVKAKKPAIKRQRS